jgi:hypothetical protein
MSKPTSRRWPSFDRAPRWTSRTFGVPASVVRTSFTVRRNAGEEAVTVRERTSTFSLATLLT